MLSVLQYYEVTRDGLRHRSLLRILFSEEMVIEAEAHLEEPAWLVLLPPGIFLFPRFLDVTFYFILFCFILGLGIPKLPGG